MLPFLKGKDLANLPDFDDKLLVYCTEKNIVSAVHVRNLKT